MKLHLSDTSLEVSVLNDLNSNTSGTINAGNITTLTGTAADLNTAYTANDNGSISGLNNENVTLSDTTLEVLTLNTLDGNTSGPSMPAASPPSPVQLMISTPPTPPTTTAPSQA